MCLICEMQITKQTFDLFFYFLVATAFEHAKKQQIFLHCQSIIESIVLEAHSGEFPDLVNIVDRIKTENIYFSSSGYLHPSHHRDCGAFPCSVMSEQNKHLVCL